MKKLVLTTLIAGATLMVSAQPAFAEEVGKQETDLGIQFETDGPNKPGDDPFKDNLALVFTPAKFNFGKQKAVGGSATYSNTVVGNQYLVVNDDREGKPSDGEVVEPKAETTTSPWKVTASMSKLVSKDSSATELPSKLMLSLGEPQSYDIGEVDPDTNDFDPNPVEGSLGTLADGHNIEVGGSVTLEAGNTTGTTVLGKTKEDSVKGGFATQINNTKLIVTSGSEAAGKSFKGSVTWSLDNTY